MGVLGQSRDQGAASVVPDALGPVDKTGFFSNIGAGFRQAVAGPHSTRVGDAIYQQRAYDQIIQALRAEGEQGEDTLTITAKPTPVKRPFRNPYVSGPMENLLNPAHNPLADLYGGGDRAEMDQIWAGVARVRQRKPDFLKQFPNEAALVNFANQRRQQDIAASQAVTSRAGTLGQVGGFVGGMAGSVASMDPENAVGGGFGTAAGKTFARTLIRRSVEGAGANAAAAIVGVPGQAADAQRLGQEMTPDDIKHQVIQAAGIGAAFGGAHVLIPKAAETVGNVAAKIASIPPVRDALIARSIAAGTIQDHSLLNEWMRTHNPNGIVDTSSPDERAAAHVILRDTATKEASPLHPEAVGANDHRLDAVAQSLGVNTQAPPVPTSAPIQTATVRDRSGSAPRRPATYEEAVHQAEGTGKNPDSSADGHFQFTKKTWLEYAPKVADTKGMSEAQILALRHDLPTATAAERLFRADNANYLRRHGQEDSPGNLSLAHFLGKGDAVKVLEADPAAPIEGLIDPRSFASNRKTLEGKSASEIIAWAHKRIGAAVDLPVARADAVPEFDALDEADYSDVPYERATFKPDELPSAVSNTHSEGEQWNPIQSGELLLWERENDERVIVDGKKRAAMAQRLYADDSSIRLPVAILRETDGISEQVAHAVGMLKNVNLGNRSLEERTAALADMPDAAELLKRPANRADIEELANLPYQDFGAVLNKQVEPEAAVKVATDARSEKLAQQIRSYWAFQKEGGFRRKPIQVVTTADGRIKTWVASASKRDVESRFHPEDGETITTLRPDNHAALDALMEIRNELQPVGGRSEEGRSTREPFGEAGSRDAAAASDAILSDRNEPSLFEHAVAAKEAAEPFSDPVGEGAKRQTELLNHDLLMDAIAQPSRELKANQDYAAATYYYDGGSRQRVHTGGGSRPSWVPDDGAVALGSYEYGIPKGGSAVEVRHVKLSGNDLTWVGVVRPSIDARFGDRSNIARVGVWLKNAEVTEPLSLLRALDRLSKWVSDPANAAKVGTSEKLQADVESMLRQHSEAFKPTSAKREASHTLFPDRRTETVSSLENASVWLNQTDKALTVFEIKEGAETSRPPEANPVIEQADTSPLDLGEHAEPAAADRQRQGAELKAEAPMRSVEEQEGTMRLGLFDVADQPSFRLSEEGDAKPLAEIMRDAEDDEIAAKAIRDCLTGGGE